MSIFDITNEDGVRINTIVAASAFVEAHFPGRWRAVADPAPEPVGETAPRRVVTRLEFRNRFSLAEKTLIYSAAQSDVRIRIFLDDLMASEEVDLDHASTKTGLALLAEAGLLTTARMREILA